MGLFRVGKGVVGWGREGQRGSETGIAGDGVTLWLLWWGFVLGKREFVKGFDRIVCFDWWGWCL